MIHAFALLAVRANPADAFIAQCGAAVRSIKEGRIGYEIKSGGQLESTSFFVKGDTALMRVSIEGAPYCDILRSPTRFLAIRYADRQYVDRTFSATPVEKATPLAPLSEGAYDFTMNPELGFVFRANPGFTEAKATSSGSQETLVARVRTNGKEELALTLSRSAKTKLPESLTLKNRGQTVESLRFYCEPRSLTDAELTVGRASYAGFTKVDSFADSSGTL